MVYFSQFCQLTVVSERYTLYNKALLNFCSGFVMALSFVRNYEVLCCNEVPFHSRPNGLILGTPGSGKSFGAKRELLDCFLTTKDDILVIDPESMNKDLA